MGGSSDVKRINDNFFDSNTQIEPMKPKSSSATIDILQSVKSGGSLKPTTYRGMKLGTYTHLRQIYAITYLKYFPTYLPF